MADRWVTSTGCDHRHQRPRAGELLDTVDQRATGQDRQQPDGRAGGAAQIQLELFEQRLDPGARVALDQQRGGLCDFVRPLAVA